VENRLQVIHAFPARMAPEIALRRIATLPPGATLLDPMCGSGTVLRAGVEAGLSVVGRDIDPLAALMAGVWAAPPQRARLLHDAHRLLDVMESIRGRAEPLPWMDRETLHFIDYWFGEPQRSDLLALATALWKTRLHSRRALQVAFSRLIVTKERGASLARDVSHSRPHRVTDSVEFDVPDEFLRSARALGKKVAPERVWGTSSISLGDARLLDDVADSSIDCVITSPPYLNALDYLRGHRMSLVWMGYSISQLRELRGESIGTERILHDDEGVAAEFISESPVDIPSRILGWTARYVRDAASVSAQLARVIRENGDVVLVVGNSRLKGLEINNALIYQRALEAAGMLITGVVSRDIPSQNRYLPTPSSGSALATRMRMEIVISAIKPVLGRRRKAA
jgi:DNA modification methylase